MGCGFSDWTQFAPKLLQWRDPGKADKTWQKVRILTESVSLLDLCRQDLLETRMARVFLFSKIRLSGGNVCRLPWTQQLLEFDCVLLVCFFLSSQRWSLFLFVSVFCVLCYKRMKTIGLISFSFCLALCFESLACKPVGRFSLVSAIWKAYTLVCIWQPVK